MFPLKILLVLIGPRAVRWGGANMAVSERVKKFQIQTLKVYCINRENKILT